MRLPAGTVVSGLMAITDHMGLRRRLARMERKLDALLAAAGIEIEMEEHMDAAGEALKQKIEGLSEEVGVENEEVVNVGNAVVSAGAKFEELKALLEKQAQAALTDEEAQTLSTLADEVGSHLSTATSELDAHVTKLGEETSAA